MKKLKKVSITDFIGVFKFLLLIIPAYSYRIYNKIIGKKILLVSEHYTARDNGYFFYKFLKENHPEVISYYAIDVNSIDYENIKKYGNIVKWGSIKHYFYYMCSNLVLLSHKNGSPNHPLFGILLRYFNLYDKVIFLQHGIIKDDIPSFYYKNAKFVKFICGAQPEYEYVKEKYGYPNNCVVYTGLARFDNLHNIQVDKKNILLMPTWRRWINSEKDFIDSSYYKSFQSFINNKELNKFLIDNDLRINFCPHFGSKDYYHCFSTNSNKITIINPEEANIQKLLIESSILITDYSSVCFDFAYMFKPMIYYQFDYDEYRKKHLYEGYFSYEKDGFGKVVDNEKELIEELQTIINNEFKISNIYKKRIKNFFPLYDNNNCERIYNEIVNGVDK